MEIIDEVSRRLQEFAHGTAPGTYILVGIAAAFYWAICEFADVRFVRTVFWPFEWVAWIILAASIVGYVWGSVPAEFLVAVPVAIWVQRMEAQREQNARELERAKEEMPTGAVPLSPYGAPY